MRRYIAARIQNVERVIFFEQPCGLALYRATQLNYILQDGELTPDERTRVSRIRDRLQMQYVARIDLRLNLLLNEAAAMIVQNWSKP